MVSQREQLPKLENEMPSLPESLDQAPAQKTTNNGLLKIGRTALASWNTAARKLIYNFIRELRSGRLIVQT